MEKVLDFIVRDNLDTIFEGGVVITLTVLWKDGKIWVFSNFLNDCLWTSEKK